MATPSYGGSTLNAPYMGTVGNTGFNPGQMTSSVSTNPWSPYFGEPMKEFKMNPYSAYGRENWALPDAYANVSLPYMTQLMIHVISEEDLWPTKIVLPIRVTESEMEIAWDEIIFNNHLLAPVPEEGVSRLVTQQMNERRDHYTRYGIALILEHGFMKTQKGQQAYRMNILQIRNATLETMYFGVIEALLKSKQYSQAWTRKYSTMARSGNSLRGFLGDEVERYMIVQKTEHGFDLLDNKAKKYLRSNSVVADTWVLPEGTATYLQMVRPENRDYILTGPAGPANYASALNNAPHNQIHVMMKNNCQVFESKSFEIPGAPGPVDPLSRIVSIGEYVVLYDTVSDMVAPSDYKSFMRDIFCFNEARDDNSRITVRSCLKASCRFDSEDNLYFPREYGMKDSAMASDPFMSGGKPCYTFGDMDKRHMSDETLWRLADSVVSKFKAARLDCDTKKFCEGEDDDLKQGSAEFKLFADWVKRIFPTSRLFDEFYRPIWNDKAEGGFYWNALSDTLPVRTKVDGRPYVWPTTTLPLGEAWAYFGFSDKSKDVDWTLVREKLCVLISSSDKASVAETALNNDTIEKFMAAIKDFGGKEPSRTRDPINWEASLMATILMPAEQLKAKALSDAAPWGKKFAYALHKGLLHIAKNIRNNTVDVKQLLDEFIDAMKAAIAASPSDPARTALQGPGQGVMACLFPSTWGMVPAPVTPPAEEMPSGHAPTFIGAHTIVHENARMTGMSQKRGRAEDNGNHGRFGAQRTRAGREYFVGDFDGDYDEKPLVPNIGPTFGARFDAVKRKFSEQKLHRAVMLTFLHTKISEAALAKLLEQDIYFPFEFLAFRPRIRHNMATGILLKAGRETGETLIGHTDFQLADDVVRKMHYGNFTLYSKSVVMKSDNVYLAENIVAMGYVGGNDVSMNTLESLQTEQGERRSMYIAMVPVSDLASDESTVQGAGGYFNPMDITGRFANNVPHLANLDSEVGNPRGAEHYPGAAFYAYVWQMNNNGQRMDQEFVYAELNSTNTLCFQGHQTAYNPSSKRFDATTINTGHFGERVYPGCGKVRRCAGMKYLEPVSYTSAFGATKQLTVVGV